MSRAFSLNNFRRTSSTKLYQSYPLVPTSSAGLHWPANRDAIVDTSWYAQWSALSREIETQKSETLVSYECRLIMYVVDLWSTHAYIWMWFVAIYLGGGGGVGAKSNRLRLETNYKLRIWSLRVSPWNLPHLFIVLLATEKCLRFFNCCPRT